jgi:hypothetical protein
MAIDGAFDDCGPGESPGSYDGARDDHVDGKPWILAEEL